MSADRTPGQDRSTFSRRTFLRTSLALGLGGAAMIVATGGDLSRIVSIGEAAPASEDEDKKPNSRIRLSFRYTRDSQLSYLGDITGTKIAVWDVANPNIRYILEAQKDQVYDAGKTVQETSDNTKLVAIQTKIDRGNGVYDVDVRAASAEDPIIDAYAKEKPCDPCNPNSAPVNRRIGDAELAFEVVNEGFKPFAESTTHKRTFQVFINDECLAYWRGIDVQKAPPVTFTPTFAPTATVTATAVPAPAQVQK